MLRPQNIEFHVGNIQEDLPPRPFDVIYGSLIFLHLANPEKTLQMCFDRLKPGGLLWIREAGDPPNASMPSAMFRWIELMASTMSKMQRRFLIVNELRETLPKMGFTNVRDVPERYTLGENTVTGRIMMSVLLASFWTMIPIVERIEKIPKDELVELHKQLQTQLQSGNTPFNLPNLVAQRPADTAH